MGHQWAWEHTNAKHGKAAAAVARAPSSSWEGQVAGVHIRGEPGNTTSHQQTRDLKPNTTSSKGVGKGEVAVG